MRNLKIDPERNRTRGKRSTAEKIFDQPVNKKEMPKSICVYQTMWINSKAVHFYIHKDGIKIRQFRKPKDTFKFISWEDLYKASKLDNKYGMSGKQTYHQKD